MEMKLALDVSAVPPRLAGAGRYIGELARRVPATGVETTLVTRRDDASRWHDWSPSTHIASIIPNARPSRLLYEAWLAGQSSTARSVDVWHSPHYTMPHRSQASTVVTVHDLAFFDRSSHRLRSRMYLGALTTIAVKRARRIICVSEFTRDGLVKRFPQVEERVRVVGEGVADSFRPQAAGVVDAFRTRHQLERPYVLFVGTNEPRKNLPSLVAAFAKVAQALPDLRLVLAGGAGWKNDQLDAAIAASGVASRVLRTGYLGEGDIPALLRRAAAVAYPAFVEGFGLPALEALSCGAPLVTSENSAMSEITGDAALLVPPLDVNGLAEAISTLVAGGAEVARRRRQGIERAAGFTWQLSAARHLEAYRLAAERTPSRFGRGPA